MAQPSVLLIGDPYSSKSSKEFLKKFVKLISSVSDNLIVISGDQPPNKENVEWIRYSLDIKNSFWNKASQYLEYQTFASKVLMNNRKSIDSVVLRSPSYLPPVILGKILNVETKLFVAQQPNVSILPQISRLNMRIGDELIVESLGVLNHWDLGHLRPKSKVGSVYVDLESFYKTEQISERENDIGYLGSLNKRKNVHKLIKAADQIAEKNPSINIVFGGTGELSNSVENLSRKHENIKYSGFINDSDLRRFYNSCRLFVLPSSSEGLPNVLLEAMACGTPSLATSISAIPDVITDGKNGFLMKPDKLDNLSAVVKSHVERDDLEQVSKRARSYVDENFSYKSALNRYNLIFSK
ncbi:MULTISPECIES: glycosyltransferase family 4 protein [Haloarcula]|uniref:glycosyltransferase family 4 protein n=1 Tax=Haloarcula TaxID=2237 RepID=UPI000F8F329F|nr:MULTISPECIES: glycosyltransferase family 4 protein [Haloarcula]NHX38165.1 glycosyltransferase family 4 protein [Haloarcula sp. R1-2]